jgi:TonB family protein
MTSKRGFVLGCLCAAAVISFTADGYTQDAATPMERLHRAILLSSIDDPQLKPWHLKLSFQLFDPKGQPTEKGTLEEWWAGQSMQKTIFTSPSYTGTEIRTKDGVYRSKQATVVPVLLEQILQQVVHPMPSERDIADSVPELRKETIAKTPMDCIMLGQVIKNVPYAPLGLFPTYCFDRDKDTLRVSYDFGSQLIGRIKVGSFQQREVPIDQSILENSITAATSHVDTLESTASSEHYFDPSNDFEKVNPNPVQVSSGVVHGLLIHSVPPVYPDSAKRNQVSGSVVLRARIGRDGRIHTLKVVSTADANLAVSALAAVRQWTYKPYLLNGEPVEVDTQITVNFAIGR